MSAPDVHRRWMRPSGGGAFASHLVVTDGEGHAVVEEAACGARYDLARWRPRASHVVCTPCSTVAETLRTKGEAVS